MEISQEIIVRRAVGIIIDISHRVSGTIKICPVYSLSVFYRNYRRDGQGRHHRTAMLGGGAVRNGSGVRPIITDVRAHAQPVVHILVQLEIHGVAFEIGSMYDPVLVEIAQSQQPGPFLRDRKSTRLNSSHQIISYAV